MNKRSESQRVIKNPQRSRFAIGDSSQNPSVLQENEVLHRKINQSKPILESIYDKVRKKEHVYKEIIRQNEQKYENANGIAREYRSFGERALKVLHKNGFMGYESVSGNYLSTNNEEKTEEGKLSRGQRRNCQSSCNLNVENANNNFMNILKEYRKGSNDSQQVAAKSTNSVYERYLSKLGENKENRRLVNGREEDTLNKVRRLSKEIDKDLESLKIKKTKSSITLKEKCVPARQTPKPEPAKQAPKDRKSYFLELQKRKLKLL